MATTTSTATIFSLGSRVWERRPAATQAKGDANGDGDVDAGDLAVWTAQFGTVSAVAAAALAVDDAASVVASSLMATSTIATVAVGGGTTLAASCTALAQAQAAFTAIGRARVLKANVRQADHAVAGPAAGARGTEHSDVAATRDGDRPLRRRAADRGSALREAAVDAAISDQFDAVRGLW